MEIPTVVLLYAALLAGATASLLYVFTLYDSVVHTINSHACHEAAYLVQIALQRATQEPGNYTARINLHYPVKIENRKITVGLDTRNPATCSIQAPQGVKVQDSTGTAITIEKVAYTDNFSDCDGYTGPLDGPKLGIRDGKYMVVTSCEPGVRIENPQIRVYAS